MSTYSNDSDEGMEGKALFWGITSVVFLILALLSASTKESIDLSLGWAKFWGATGLFLVVFYACLFGQAFRWYLFLPGIVIITFLLTIILIGEFSLVFSAVFIVLFFVLQLFFGLLICFTWDKVKHFWGHW